MGRSKAERLTPAKTLDGLVEFFDANDMGELWEQMPEAQFDVDIKSRTHLVAIDEELARRLTEIARSRRVSSEKLINTWLKERTARQRNAR
jgi:hypothetical protein